MARRLVEDAGVAGLTFHPRSAAVRHKGTPDYELAARLVEELPVPVIVSGGMAGPEHVRGVFESTGCAAVMLARGSLGNPWLFAQLLDEDAAEPGLEEVLAEWNWVIDRCVEHLGPERAARYLRKFHPWYLERLGLGSAPRARDLQDALQRAETVAAQRAVLAGLGGALTRLSARPLRDGRAVLPSTAVPPCVLLSKPRFERAFFIDGAPSRSEPDPKPSRTPLMQKDVILTPEGLQKLKDEIEELSTVKRREVAERIKEAREFGDISENSEYDDAKNEQAMLETRIASLEDKLRAAQVIDASSLSSDIVRVGSVVDVKDEDNNKNQTYTIVGSTEADPGNRRLSNESPVGKALIGHKKGDVVSVPAPKGERKLKIVKIDVA